MSGRLNVLAKVIPPYVEDMFDGDLDEQAAATCMFALKVAIESGTVGELADLVRPWMAGKIVANLHAQGLDDQSREDAIAGLQEG